MRPKTEFVRTTAVLVVVALAMAALPTDARSQDASSRWRSSRYGRGGAEIWGEVPRFVLPVGQGYDGDHDLGAGVGFGFGLMFGFSDKLALEGRMLQTGHKGTDGRLWDIDQYLMGMRYTFFHEEALQPYVALGGARLSLEWNAPESGLSGFERLWGYGAYATAGVDYVVSSRWVVGLRSDYAWMRYTRANIGTDEANIEDPLNGSTIGFSLSLHYRVPVSW
jgi:hypothetical protein